MGKPKNSLSHGRTSTRSPIAGSSAVHISVRHDGEGYEDGRLRSRRMTVSVAAKYPCLPFVDDVQVVFDIGAHDGASSAHFARHYPGAVVHGFEPDAAARAHAECDLAAYPNAH